MTTEPAFHTPRRAGAVRRALACAGIAASLFGCADGGGPTPVESAARTAMPEVAWQPASVISGDFTCRARPEYALLGTTPDEIVVIVFASAPLEPAGVLRVPAAGKDIATLTLSRDDLDFEVEDFEHDVGPLPEGLYPSKTCMGLSLSDGRGDAVHVYWNRSTKALATWSR